MKKVIILLVMGLVLFSFFYVTNEFTENELQEIHASFPEIETKEEIVGKICGIYKSNSMVFRDNPHSEYITLEDSSRYRLNTGYELKQGLILDETIKLGMLLVKNAGSKNIRLIKLNESDSTIYHFELTDDLGYGKETFLGWSIFAWFIGKRQDDLATPGIGHKKSYMIFQDSSRLNHVTFSIRGLYSSDNIWLTA